MFPGTEPGIPCTGRRLQLLAGVTALFIVPFLFIGGPDWSSGPVYKSAWNLGHILLFALLTIAVRPWRWLQGWRLWLAVTGVLLATGLVIELLQYGHNREVDWRDLLRNLIGSWLIIAWRPLFFSGNRKNAGSVLVATLTTLLLVSELGTTAQVAARQFQMNRQLPALYDFQREEPSPFWSGPLTPSEAHAPEGSKSLKINLGTETYSGVSLHNFPSDWREFTTLSLTLFNPDSRPLSVTVRINDVEHDRGDNAYSDRFNLRLDVEPGVNTFTIPLATIEQAPDQRPMDMSEIRRLGLFATRLPEPRSVYLLALALD